MTPAGLETRYRRLLRWYPAEHRAVHQEEMLGVLLAGAGPGQGRPGLAESADLLLGAARLRRGRQHPDPEDPDRHQPQVDRDRPRLADFPARAQA